MNNNNGKRYWEYTEWLVNLGLLPFFEFKVACFPLKIEVGIAGPARVVAILEE